MWHWRMKLWQLKIQLCRYWSNLHFKTMQSKIFFKCKCKHNRPISKPFFKKSLNYFRLLTGSAYVHIIHLKYEIEQLWYIMKLGMISKNDNLTKNTHIFIFWKDALKCLKKPSSLNRHYPSGTKNFQGSW